jgi:hypothetical protein
MSSNTRLVSLKPTSVKNECFITYLAGVSKAFGMYRIKCKLRPLMTTNHAEVLIKQNKPSRSPCLGIRKQDLLDRKEESFSLLCSALVLGLSKVPWHVSVKRKSAHHSTKENQRPKMSIPAKHTCT